MREIKFYGEKATTLPNELAEKEIAKNKEKLYKKRSALDNATLIMFLVLIAENMMFFSMRIIFQEELLIKVLALLVEAVIIAVGICIFSVYKKSDPLLSARNVKVLLGSEIALCVSEFILYHFYAPALIWFLFACSPVFVVYTLKFVKCKLKIRVGICLVLIPMLFVSFFINLRKIEFTPRYVYLSTSGYEDKESDEDNLYYKDKINSVYYSPTNDYVYTNGTQEDTMNDIKELTESLSGMVQGIYSVNDTYDSLNYLNEIYDHILPMGKIINVDNRYDDEFFKKNMLFLSVVELENKNDIIKCTDMQYSIGYTKPYYDYYRSNETINDKDDSEKALCIIIYEVPVEVYEKIFLLLGGFSERTAKITYR